MILIYLCLQFLHFMIVDVPLPDVLYELFPSADDGGDGSFWGMCRRITDFMFL